ncbi:Hsp20/alpha crystallin family protein [Geomonas azotofigens]|uniref:Hsp20/alpha crystallin family protein n=1 Tax=Geomonas azotofigens TaxID=2843196 RepID=UPI001C104918|nr:Hsp20/alpha crystallin family protein [Geomonas azotofigens]MBU5611430.1 Hsp20/alpha crystallin family protein [Geomonas azotofigens]
MATLVPEKWREALEHVQDKVGTLLNNLVPAKREERTLENLTADAIPAFMQRGGPLVDMHETAEELVIRAEVPGMNKEDFKVELVDRRLTIRGEKKIVREEKGSAGGFLSECRYGSFSRSVTLPYPVDEEKIKADLKHGVLTIRLPKPEQHRGTGHRIPIS